MDRFCAYNARFGHAAGDALLIDLGSAISRVLSPESAGARLHADRFALLVPRPLLDEAVFLTRFSHRPEGAFCSVRSGVYEIGDVAPRPADMLDNALLALRAAKRGAGERRTLTYHRGLREEALFFQDVVREFAPALRDGLIGPRFQPIVSYPGGSVAGVEVLARWKHAEGGRTDPSRFVPVLEEAGFAAELDMHMVVRALVHLKGWVDRGLGTVPVSVNLSRSSLRAPGLPDRMTALLDAYRLPSSLICLEVSEEAWSSDPAQLKAALSRLRDAGFSIAVDDFGAGATSLEDLAGSPVDVIKIDKSFLRSQMSERDGMVVKSLVRLAHDLGLAVVVEGVETEEQALFLKEAGVDRAQGYLYAPPLDRASFEALLGGGGSERGGGSPPLRIGLIPKPRGGRKGAGGGKRPERADEVGVERFFHEEGKG